MKVSNDLSNASDLIDAYYASKHKSKPEEETDTMSHHGSSASSYEIAVPGLSTRETQELKRNSILFPNLRQEEIDARILAVCEAR